jgi:DNA-binding CsgD family transcriptional regulator
LSLDCGSGRRPSGSYDSWAELAKQGVLSLEIAWPLVGRKDELSRVSELLQAGPHSLVLAGLAGVGKSRLAAECLKVAGSHGYATLNVSGTQVAAGLPFGAYAGLIPDLEADADKTSVLRRIAKSVADSGRGKQVAVLVDDVHMLDEASAALTHLLASQEGTCVLATLRSGELIPGPIAALWKDGLAERIEVQPFDQGQVTELLSAALGGPVDGATAYLLSERTEGNALFLRELVLAALASGTLALEEGIWRLNGRLPTSTRLVEIVEARLGELNDSERKVIGVLAVGEPLELEMLRSIHPEADLEDLETRGLVQVREDGHRLTARLHHPLYGEALRAKLPKLRSRTIFKSLAGALQAAGARRREDVLRLATWQLEGGDIPNPQTMLAAAVAARWRHDYPLAERLARAAIETGAGFDAEVLLGQLCWLQGRPDEAERQLDGLEKDATDDSQRARLGSLRVIVLDHGLKRAEDALRVAEQTAKSITDPVFLDEINVERARILGRSGSNREAVRLVEPLLGRATGRTLISACFAAWTSMPATGQFAGAIEAAERGFAAHSALEGQPLPFSPAVHLAFKCWALGNMGRLFEAWELGTAQYEKAVKEGSPDARAFHCMMLALTAFNQGRVLTSARLAREGAGVFKMMGLPPMLRNNLMILALALAHQGEVPSARSVLAEIDALGVPKRFTPGPELIRARAWTEVAAGDLPAARAFLYEAIEMARDGGAEFLESEALHDLARLGHPSEVEARLRELSESVEGPLIAARVRHTAGLVRRDPTLLQNASTDFAELGAMLLAAEAWADAAVAWRRKGEVRKAAAAERRSGAMAAKCEGAVTPTLATASSARSALTPRELEIARLAALGLANKQIAERLFLSYRTVENKLHAVYEKLGIERREQLTEALERY